MEKKQRERRGGLRKESGIWRCYFMIKGRRYFRALPDCKNKTEAKAERDRLKTLARAGKLDAGGSSTSSNFERFTRDTFLPWVETNLSPGTYQSYKWRCDHLIAAFGKLDLSEISVFAIEKFKREQMKRVTKRGDSQSPASVNRYLQILASIFTRAEEMGIIDHNMRPKFQTLREDNNRLRYLSVDEERRLLLAAAAWPHLEDVLIVGLQTGLRRDELFSLRKEDVDLSLDLVNVLDGKGGKARSVPLDPEGEAYKVLTRLRRDSRSEWIFTSPHSGRKLTRVTRSLAAACKAAEIEPVTLHALRHTFCTRLAAAGVDVRTIKELAGHEDLSTTMRYMHLVESNKIQAIRRLRNYHEITTSEVIPLKAKAG